MTSLMVAQMTSKPDWDVLGALFSKSAPEGATASLSASKGTGPNIASPAHVKA